MQQKTRLFSARAAVMLLMMLLTATTAWAEGVDYIPNGVTLRQANFTDDGDNTYTIHNATGWDVFCDALQDNDTYNRFIGTYNPIVWETENRSVLFLGGNNTLYFPQPDGDNNPHVNAFRGYFQLNGITASDITEARMSFDGEENITGIVEAEANSSLFILHSSLSEWYTINGVKLNAKPTAKGVYIHGGRKVAIK